jgi:tetratricopeptide (TPR) repeat protein
LACAFTGYADSVSVEGLTYDGIVNGVRNGKLSITLYSSHAEQLFDVDQVASIALDSVPKFSDAELARSDPLKATALYKALIPTLNKPEIRLLAEWRAIEPLDKNNQWTDAVNLFLDVYQSSPTDGVWKSRPTHLPGASSKMLPDSADKVTAAIKMQKDDSARKNLRGMLLEIYTKAGDTQAAERIAREMTTGIAEDPPPKAAAPAESLTAALAQIDAAMSAKDFAAAIKQADQLLLTADGESAAQLFALKARAQEGAGQGELAAATWLRIAAHYPESALAPAALLSAAQLQQKLNHTQAAQSIYREITEKYPDTKEAQIAKPLAATP